MDKERKKKLLFFNLTLQLIMCSTIDHLTLANLRFTIDRKLDWDILVPNNCWMTFHKNMAMTMMYWHKEYTQHSKYNIYMSITSDMLPVVR